ncbi:hypothetical protein DFJ58DRAFT_670597 [Suillus subalutaceus]|uniref:uncharacterized protein n=1 Tax=Suillus subalutaceus TaxID=48586 RepID=UPI001B862A5F|nr:uncharacterized protein DFJ58DRAFT_670597 [Suillus subalutaceus]KAG1834628.1 hypothetical protein DFJ58DRAFT_670597 [Suillus subalutaceus]
MASSHGPTPPTLSSIAAETSVPSGLDTFKTEYHPKSGCATTIETFSTFGRKQDQWLPIIDEEPWQLFSCRADFEFAELAHNAALNKDHTDELLRLIWRIAEGHVKFTFKSHRDVSSAWDRAASQMTPFEKHTITARHKREDLTFDVYTRPLWDWALDLLQDPLLAPHFPWTADRWWNVQSSLPENGVPFAFILYADKTHLSSAGTIKAYPVFARCGNLPVHIRNTDGLGGGRMVGWLPIVPEDSKEDGKLSYVNLKRVVWHDRFLKLLETIILYAKTGYAHLCSDGIVRWLYAFILLLLADYEEQCVMALIWGTNCHCPCPICLVPSDKLYDNASTYPIRSPEDAQSCVELWKKNKAAGEEALKKWGLRPVMNVFWQILNSNPHEMISQDHLHVYHIGEWGKHLFGELKRHAAALGRSAEKKIDDQFAAFTRWRNLNHFDRVTNITCSDGNKLRDISKQILYTTQNVLMRTDDEAGYALLRCIASYLHIDMYVSLDVHTESTIQAGKAEVLVFQTHLEDYIAIIEETDPDATKNWNFPKMHASKHIFDDILTKGAARNFSTRPNEKQHGPIKRWYLRQTNCKDIANQVCRCQEVCFSSITNNIAYLYYRSLYSTIRASLPEFIRSCIEFLDEERHKLTLSREELEDTTLTTSHLKLTCISVTLTSLAQVEEDNRSNHAFDHFRKKLTMFLNHFLPSHNIPLPDGIQWLKLSAHDQVHKHRYLKVHYESAATWKLATDYLRCSPSFHGHKRRDCALIRTQDKDGHDKYIFVKLLFVFKLTVCNRTLDLALVLPMDASPRQRLLDRDLRLTRLRAQPAALSEFVTLHSIIRGALLVPDFDNHGDYFLVDYVDTDMFLQVQRNLI